MGKVENGPISVNAYGVIDNIAFPLTFEAYKPNARLKARDDHLSNVNYFGLFPAFLGRAAIWLLAGMNLDAIYSS
ncbi:hypothetical protein [Vacuolonema iberomarrocanum]|uniref:hypothetical protein n=1 Tax=Vacuolonema iberomarrocanum TaxID=3454632 RepID=UPI0019F1DA99|nr:hypothetical protein [filamentous cyanobacterium LEGE 07170]